MGDGAVTLTDMSIRTAHMQNIVPSSITSIHDGLYTKLFDKLFNFIEIAVPT